MTDFDVTEDITLDDLKSNPVPELKNVKGIVKKIEISQPQEKTGNQFVNITIEHPFDSSDRTSIRAPLVYNKDRMRQGADNSDLEKNIQTTVRINKRRCKDFLTATDSSSFTQAVDKPIIFSAGPSYMDEEEYEFTKFYKPKE